MHAYRDALDAESVWILYPGRGVGIKHFSPHTGSSSAAAGVGAIPLTPGQQGAALGRVVVKTASDLQGELAEALFAT